MERITFLTLLGFLVFSSCTPEADPVTPPETGEDEREEEVSIDYDNI